MTDTYRGLTLDAFQRDALAAIDRSENVVVAAPTGAGKTLIAEYALEHVLAQGGRAIYTAPIKALSNQKYRDLSAAYPGQVGISTGDVSIDPGAPIVIMTTEIFRNTIFDDPARAAEISWVIFDEIHFLDDPDRGTVWEESLIFAPPSVRILGLSATVSNLDEFVEWLREVRDSVTTVVLETERPVPLTVHVASTEGEIRPLHEVNALRLGKHAYGRRMAYRKRNVRAYYEQAQRALIKSIAARKELPLLFFIYSRAQCSAVAASVSNLDFMPNEQARRTVREEFDRLVQAFELDPQDRDTKELRRLALRGISFHHAGILPPLKEVVERLFGAGHIRVLCCTETFALGVNMPARSVAFEGIRKWNGVARVPLKTREYQQMAGRAGRRGIDEKGSVYVTFDPFNDDPSLVTSLVNGRVEPVQSQFNLSYGTLLNLYDRLGDEIYTACERSFANFKARRAEKDKAEGKQGKGKGKGRDKWERGGKRHRDSGSEESGRWRKGRRGQGYGRGRRGSRESSDRQRAVKGPSGRKRYANVVEQVKVKLGVLAELGYLDANDKVTPQGRYAMQVFGHELVVTELVWSGILERLTPTQIAVLAGAIVHESRSNVFYGGPSPKKVLGKDHYRVAQRVVANLVGLEEERGVLPPSKELDWNLTGVFQAWAEGAEFAELRAFSDASDGDVVRAFRQAIQVLRLCVRPLRKLGRHTEAGRATAARDLLKRGLVDAEWQLRKASEVLDGEEAPEDEEQVAAPEATHEPVEESLTASEEAFSAGLLDSEPPAEEPPADGDEEKLTESEEAFSDGLL